MEFLREVAVDEAPLLKKFITQECGALASNRFDFWNKRSRMGLKPSFDQNWRKLKILTGTPLNYGTYLLEVQELYKG